MEWASFSRLLAVRARVPDVSPSDKLFGAGLDLSSIRFTEFIMELEEEFDIDMDVDSLTSDIATAGELYDALNRRAVPTS